MRVIWEASQSPAWRKEREKRRDLGTRQKPDGSRKWAPLEQIVGTFKNLDNM